MRSRARHNHNAVPMTGVYRWVKNGENLRVPESDDTRCVIRDAKTIGSKLEFTKHFEYDVLYEKHPKEHKTTTL